MSKEADTPKPEHWHSSQQAKALLKVTDCHLMHLRLQGALKFKKVGNRFFYWIETDEQPNKD